MQWCPALPWALVACALSCTFARAADDIDPEGPCKAALARLCAQVEPGIGARATCLREQQRAARERKEEPLPHSCALNLHSFFINATRNGDMMLVITGVKAACATDIQTHCADKTGFWLKSCLRATDRKGELTTRCKEKLFQGQRHESQHIELDTEIATACKEDLETIPACKALPTLAKPGERKACLLLNRKSASSKCRDALFHRMQHDLTDVRLNEHLFSTCRSEITHFCGSLEYGESRVMKCLFDKKGNTGFSADCREKVIAAIRFKAQDYRLDSVIHRHCEGDISKLCAKEQLQVDHLPAAELFGDNWQEGKSGVVIQCLKANFSKINDTTCRSQIRRMIRVHAEQATADPIFERHCRTDINKFCNKTEPERLHLCLHAHFQDLESECRSVEVIQGSLSSMDISMKPTMQTACVRDIPKFCQGVATGDAQVIQCLQDHMEDKEMGGKCSEIVAADLEASNHDWRLKWGIHHNCMLDAGRLCAHAVPEAAGAVLACLKANTTAISSQSCRSEMFRFIKQGVSNIRFAPGTYSACVGDVQRFCTNIRPGQGRVHDCLMGNRTLLSDACRKTEFRTQEIASTDMRMTSFWPLCFKSVRKLCPDVPAGSGRIWNCISKQKDNPEIEPACAKHIRSHVFIENTEFYLNPDMVKHCEADAKRLCSFELEEAAKKDFRSEGAVISCLVRERKNVRVEACKSDLRDKALQRLGNIENDQQAYWSCKDDIDEYCDEEHKRNQGQGLVHTCLQKHFADLSYNCRLTEFEYMTLQVEDARMNLFIRRECKAAVKRFCGDTVPGNGQQIVCMLRHMHDTSMEADCREKLKKLQRLRANNLIFNPQLAAACETDLKKIQEKFASETTCKQQDDQDLVLQGAALSCLTAHHKEANATSCKALLRNTLYQQSYDMRALPGLLYNYCKDDVQRLCKEVEPGNGRWHTCLRKNRAQIKDKDCKNVVLKVLANERNDVLLNPGIRIRCSNEIKTFCRNIARGESRILVCLQQHSKDVGFSSGCHQAMDTLGANATIPAVPPQDSASALKSFLDYKSFWDKWGLALIGGITILLVVWIIGIIAVIKRLRSGKGLYGITIDQPAEVVGAGQDDKA